jgi:hypothetical protein
VRLPAQLVCAALVGLLASPLYGQSTTTLSRYSPYERETIERAIADVGGVLDPAPEGKLLERIDVVPLEVIEARDPAPSFLNIFHATTRAEVLRREVLLVVGEPWRQYRVDETVRSLRVFQQLSLVLAVPLRGTTPDRVRLLLVTKDVWSLRAQMDVKLGSNGLDLLKFEPTERNVAGRLNSALSRFELYPKTVTLGAGAFIPRLSGKTLYLGNDANVIVNRDSGSVEGTFGSVFVSTPQLSVDQKWLWGVGTTWRNEIVRRYVAAEQATFDADVTNEDDRIPDGYRARRFTHNGTLARSFGRARKVDIAFGAELNVRRFHGLDPTAFDARVVEEYRSKRVPTSDTRVGPWVQARAYEGRFVRIHDYETLGLQEDFRVGYDAFVRAYPITKALGSSRDFVGIDAFAQYVLPISDGLARASGESLLEVTGRDIPAASFAANAVFVSPRFFLGRLIVDGLLIARPENYLNLRSVLGGEGRLRGQPSAVLLGQNLMAYNVELRTRPIEILASEVGAAAFFDVGDAFDAWPAMPRSSTGIGLRGLFPQLDRKVFRVDVAFPIVRAAGAGPVGFYIAFEQAFPSVVTAPPGAGAAQSFLNTTGGALGQ